MRASHTAAETRPEATNAPQRKEDGIKKSLQLLISVVLLAAILWYADAFDDIVSLFVEAAPQFLALALVVMTLDRLLMTFKWILLLESRGLALSLYNGFKIYCATMIWGMFMPATVGADALRAYLTSRKGLNGYEVTASIIVERMIGFLAALLMGLVGMLILSSARVVDDRFDSVWWAGGILLAGGVAAVALSFSENVFDTMLRFVPARLRSSKVVQGVRKFHGIYRGYGRERRTLAVFFLLTVLEHALTVFGVWLLAVGLHVDVPLWHVLAAVPLSMLIARLPITFDGLGVFEGVFVVIMGLAGVGAAEALSIALAGRLVQIVAWAPWWLLYSLDHDGVRPGEAGRAVSDR